MKRQPCNLGFLVADIARLMRRTYRQRQQRSELTVAQARTLVHVARREGVRQVDLAETLEVQPITLARLRRLEQSFKKGTSWSLEPHCC